MERRILGSTLQRGSFGLALLLVLAAPVWAVDGVVDINQARALAGGVTPGDTVGFPVTISQSGSYRLTGNLTVPDANTTAISVTAANVTIDLNGFTILGPTVCSGNPTSCTPTGSGRGIDATSADNVNVLNGTIQGMGNTGVSLGGTAGGRVDGVSALSNGSTGIIGDSSHTKLTVTNSKAIRNGFIGIANTYTVTNSLATENGSAGGIISAITVTNSTATFNGGPGISAVTVANCTAFVNGVGGGGPQITADGITGQNICGSPGTPCPP